MVNSFPPWQLDYRDSITSKSLRQRDIIFLPKTMFQILPATCVMLLLHTHVVSQIVTQTLTPIPNGMCWKTNNTLYGNESVNTLEMGSCGFNNTLCSYSQGCSDTGTSWTKHEDDVRYIGNGGEQSKFSVLLSPVLDIQYVSCLTYDFIAEHPGRLSVFLANHSHVTNIIDEDPMNIETFKQVSTSLPPSVSLIGFRARDCLPDKPVKLKDVKIQDGNCISLMCDFSDDSFCGWHQINWTLTPSIFIQDWTARMNITANIASMVTGNFTRVNSSSGQGIMTSFMTRANDPHCLNFSYIVGGVDAKLDIHIQFLDKPENIHCSVSSNESYPFHLGRGSVHVSTKIPYNVSFVGSGCDSDKCIVGIDDFTTLKRNCSTTLNCYVNPSILMAANWTSAMNNVTDNLETTQNLDEFTSEGTKASERAEIQTGMDSSSTTEINKNYASSSSLTFIVIACADVVIFIAIIIVIVVFLVRRRQKHITNSKNTTYNTDVQNMSTTTNTLPVPDLIPGSRQQNMTVISGSYGTSENQHSSFEMKSSMSPRSKLPPDDIIPGDETPVKSHLKNPSNNVSAEIPISDRRDIPINAIEGESKRNNTKSTRLPEQQSGVHQIQQSRKKTEGADEGKDEYKRPAGDNPAGAKKADDSTLKLYSTLHSYVRALATNENKDSFKD